jgi:hypothetical protein
LFGDGATKKQGATTASKHHYLNARTLALALCVFIEMRRLLVIRNTPGLARTPRGSRRLTPFGGFTRRFGR